MGWVLISLEWGFQEIGLYAAQKINCIVAQNTYLL